VNTWGGCRIVDLGDAMWTTVLEYSLAWKADINAGNVCLNLSGGGMAVIVPDSIQELAALGDILRNEKPVFYNTVTAAIKTGWEPTGEEE